LVGKCTSPAKLITPEKMEHNVYEIYQDVIIHMKKFLELLFQSQIDNEAYNTLDINEFDRELIDDIHFPLFMYSDPYEI
jgi:hypothetical protein